MSKLFTVNTNGKFSDFDDDCNICWVKIDEKIIEEISALKVVEVDASHVKETVDIEGNFFYIKGVLCGKSVHWDLDECEEDWQARACLQNLQNLVKNFSEAHLALHFDAEAGVVTGFAACRVSVFHTIAIEQLQDGEDF